MKRRTRELQERLEFAYRSIPSESHPSYTEDALLADLERGLFGVVDGAGRSVAATAVSAVNAALGTVDAHDEPDALRPMLANSLRAADKAVVSYGHHAGRPAHASATLAMLHRSPKGIVHACLAHVGHCRAYLRGADGSLTQLTTDDDLLANHDERDSLEALHGVRLTEADIDRYRGLLDEAAYENIMADALGQHLYRVRHLPARALGHGPAGVHTHLLRLRPGETLLVASDGMHASLRPGRIRDIAALTERPDELAGRLAAEAYEYGHLRPHRRDDITVLVVRLKLAAKE